MEKWEEICIDAATGTIPTDEILIDYAYAIKFYDPSMITPEWIRGVKLLRKRLIEIDGQVLVSNENNTQKY